MCRRMDTEELTDVQIRRLDEVYDAAMEFIRVLLCDPDREFDMSLVGNMTDDTVALLNEKGFDVYFPSIIYDERGTYTVDSDSEVMW